MGTRIGSAIATLAIAVASAGCALTPGGTQYVAPATPHGAVPTSCGGSHAWPPNGFAGPPAGMSVVLVSGTTVRVRNDTDQTWVAWVAAWEDLPCTGYLAATDSQRSSVPPHGTFDATVADPHWGGKLRIGVEFWDHPCDETCTDPPTGFAYVDPAVTPSP